MAPIDSPDGTQWMQLVQVVGEDPVPEQPGTETAIAPTQGKVTDSSQTYQTLATWTVAASSAGVLRSIEIAADQYSLARFQLTINGVVQFTGLELPDALTLYFADTRLTAGTVVLVEGKSSSGAAVAMWSIIEGKEVA